MKRLFYSILLITTVQTFGQTPARKAGFTQFYANNQYNRLWSDSMSNIAYRDTTSAAIGVGETRFRPADSTIYVWTGSQWLKGSASGSGSVTSVNASISGALGVAGGPIVSSGTLAFTWQGTNSQYVRGDGSLSTFSSDVTAITSPLYAYIGHTHTSSQITDFNTASRALFSGTGGINYNSLTGVFSLASNSQQDGLISGGKVVWSGSGLVFDVTSATYVIGGSQYVSPATSITLDAADATYDRYDIIAVDVTGNAVKVTGTPSASPVVPQIDPASQIYLTTIFIAAGATTPTLISNELVYDENTEWSHSTSGSITANFANTTYAAHGTKSISATWSGTANLIFTNGSSLLTNNYSTVSFYIRLVSTMNANANISVQFYNGSTPVSNQVITYIGKGLLGQFQLVSLNVSDFIFSSSSFNSVRLILTGSNTSNPAYIDYVRLQSGVQQPQQQSGLQSAYTKFTDGTNTAIATGSDVFKLGTDNTMSVTVGDNNSTHGDNANFKVDTTVIATKWYASSLATATAPTLQQVTDAGNFTSNYVFGITDFSGDAVAALQRVGSGGEIYLSDSTGTPWTRYKSNRITNNYNNDLYFPVGSGSDTFALLKDIRQATGGGGIVATHGVTVLKNYYTQTTSTGSGTTDNVTIVNIPANTLSNDGDVLEIDVAYTTTGVDTKNVDVTIGSGTTLIGSPISTTAGKYIHKIKVIRNGSASAIIRGESWRELTLFAVSQGINTSMDWTTSQDLKVALTSTTAASITINYVSVKVVKE